MRTNNSEMIEQIAEKDFDVNAFVQLEIKNEHARNEIARQMLTDSRDHGLLSLLLYCRQSQLGTT